MKTANDAPQTVVEEARHAERWIHFQAQVLNALGQAVMVFEPNGTIIFWNRAAEKLYGWRAEEAVGRNVVELVAAEFAKIQALEIMEILRSEQCWNGEFPVRRRDGSVFPVAGTNSPVYDEQGKFIAIVSVTKDITERKAAEERLARREIQLSTAQQLAHIGSWEWDISTDKFVCSDELYRIYGLQPEEYRATYEDLHTYVHPEDREYVERIFAQAILSGERVSFEQRIIRKDRSIRTLHTIGEVVADKFGVPVQMYGATQDVTEARQAETALRESEERFREMADNIEDVFWIKDLGATQLHYISPAYEKSWGRSCRELYVRPSAWKESIHPEDLANTEEVLITDRVRHDHVYRIIKPDGAIRWIRDRAFPVRDAFGNVARIAGFATDITEAKEAQIALQKTSEQLQILSQRLIEVQEYERRHLARELHDEIGQVLTATKIMLQSMQQSPEAAPFATLLQESVGSIDLLLQRVRRISLDLRPPLLDHLGVVPALRSHLDQTAKLSGLEVCFLAPETWDRFDPKIEIACFRVVQEALTNIVRHARAKRVTVELQGDGWLSIVVRDDGIGFEPEKVIQSAHQGATAGILGMRERVAILGGTLDIRSAPGKGTEVHALFPLETRKS